MICRLEEVRAQTLGLEWTGARDFGARGRTGDAGTVGPLQDLAAAATSASRKGHSLFRRYPPERQSAVLPRSDTLLFQKFAASELRDHLRIEGGQLQLSSLVEHPLPRLDPLRFRVQFFGFDQRLGANALQHFPISFRLAVRHVDWIRAKIPF